MKNKTKEKIFLIFNTSCFGDVIICNSLCQNIKRLYPDSKIVFIVNKPFYEAALGQEGVDEVIIYDKKGKHKGIKGFFKFIKDFKYKKPDVSIVAYKNTRNFWTSVFIGSKKLVNGKKFRLDMLSQTQVMNLLKNITKEELIDCPVKFKARPVIPEHLKEIIPQDKNYISLCTTTKNPPKDMPVENCIELINKINKNTNYKVLFTGAGDTAKKYAENLKSKGCNFIDLVNKTSISELANILKASKCLISVDTGTMHLGYAVGVPLIAVFYEDITLGRWAPNPKFYNSILIKEDQTPENIFIKTLEIINR